MDQRDPVVRHAEDRMRDLRQHRLQSLAVAVRTNPEFEPAIGCEARLALLVPRYERNSPAGVDAGAVAGLLRIHGGADAEQPAVGFAMPLAFAQRSEADRIDRLPQCCGIVAGIEVPFSDVVERHLLGAHQAAQTEVCWLNAEVSRQGIERQLQGEANAGASYPSIRQDWRFVRRDRVGAASIVRKVVDTGKDASDLAGLQTC